MDKIFVYQHKVLVLSIYRINVEAQSGLEYHVVNHSRSLYLVLTLASSYSPPIGFRIIASIRLFIVSHGSMNKRSPNRRKSASQDGGDSLLHSLTT